VANNAPVVLRLTATAGVQTASDDVTISPQPETLTALTVRYRTGTREWRISGTSNITSAAHNVAIVMVPPTGPAVFVGQASAAAGTGVFAFRATAPVAPGVPPAGVPGSTLRFYSEFGAGAQPPVSQAVTVTN
jgi:hypothetical protein